MDKISNDVLEPKENSLTSVFCLEIPEDKIYKVDDKYFVLLDLPTNSQCEKMMIKNLKEGIKKINSENIKVIHENYAFRTKFKWRSFLKYSLIFLIFFLLLFAAVVFELDINETMSKESRKRMF